MKKNIKCPFWSKKKGECKLMDIIELLSKNNALLAQTVEAYAPPKTSLDPVPGSHGQTEGHSPAEMATVQAPPPPPFFSFLGGLAGDKPKLPRIGEKEEQEKKQEYWEKELEKMDKGKGKK